MTQNAHDESPNVYSLTYVSASSHLLSETELDEILQKSRHNNTRRDITGMLLYIEGSIFQVLEGPETEVMSLYQTIRADPRHHMIIPLLEERRPQRNFPDWSMGFRRITVDELRQAEGFRDLHHIYDFLHTIRASPEKSHVLLRSFCTSNIR